MVSADTGRRWRAATCALVTMLVLAAGCGSAPGQLRSSPASPADMPREIVLAPRPLLEATSFSSLVSDPIASDPIASGPIGEDTDGVDAVGVGTVGVGTVGVGTVGGNTVRVGDLGDVVVGRASVRPRDTIVAEGASDRIVARERPDDDAAVIRAFDNPTERGAPMVFQALDEPSRGWIEVRLPIRPNGSTGWVRVSDVTLSRNPYRVDVDVDRFELRVYRSEEQVLRTTVAIGTGATPTPIGDFFLTELFRPPDPGGLYGPFAYGLSGFSDTIDSFNGGPGIIGVHGTNQPELLGSNVSHGCIRVDNAVITEMASFLPLGTPITIR